MQLATLALVSALLVQDPAPPPPELPVPVPCKLDAWIECPGGKIEFKLDVRAPSGKGGTPTFALLNGARGEDVTWIERWDKAPESLVLKVLSYDSQLEFMDQKIEGELRGTWRKLSGPGKWLELPVRGRVAAPADAAAAAVSPLPASLAGRWSVAFEGAADPAVGVFTHPTPDTIAGTFLTTLGDYRYLAGRFDPEKLLWRLSCFDGAHAFLFILRPQKDGTLSGDFWSGEEHESWTAKRDEKAALPDPFGLTKAEAKVDLSKLTFVGEGGARVSLADPRFAGKPLIIQVFGTWCPNCNDEAEYLRELDRMYKLRGLSVVGLAFELGGDEERDLAQLKHFATRHRLQYPLLLAGKADKAEASKAFPLLDKVRAYPTTIFMRADGSVLAVHQGYSGPATGPEHQKLRKDFERLIAELLVQKPK